MRNNSSASAARASSLTLDLFIARVSREKPQCRMGCLRPRSVSHQGTFLLTFHGMERAGSEGAITGGNPDHVVPGSQV